MSLIELNNPFTDKGTYHSYLDVYDELLQYKKHTARNVLEIGIGDFFEKNGGSIKLWVDYFTSASIVGIDILSKDRVLDELLINDRITLHLEKDAYDEKFVQSIFQENNRKFDLILDDGPHSLESMISFIELYMDLLEEDGILIIEDIPSIEWIQTLTSHVPDSLKPFIQVYDLRCKKGRYDDILFVIDKSRTS